MGTRRPAAVAVIATSISPGDCWCGMASPIGMAVRRSRRLGGRPGHVGARVTSQGRPRADPRALRRVTTTWHRWKSLASVRLRPPARLEGHHPRVEVAR